MGAGCMPRGERRLASEKIKDMVHRPLSHKHASDAAMQRLLTGQRGSSNVPPLNERMVRRVLQRATEHERLRLAKGLSNVGWDVHGTHVFAIPVALGTESGTDAGDLPPTSPDAPVLVERGTQSDPRNSGAQDSGTQTDPSQQQQQQIPVYYRIYYPYQRASSVWWNRQQGEPDEPAVDPMSIFRQQHHHHVGLMDLVNSVLARWDHHDRTYRSVHDQHVYCPPPPQAYCPRSCCAQGAGGRPCSCGCCGYARGPIAGVVQRRGGCAAGCSSLLPYEQQQQSRKTGRGSRGVDTWTKVAIWLVVIFTFLTMLSNVGMYWPALEMHGANRVAADLLYAILCVVVVAMILWAALTPWDDGGLNVWSGDGQQSLQGTDGSARLTSVYVAAIPGGVARVHQQQQSWC